MVYFVTGKSGAGKTHYAYELVGELHNIGKRAVVLDGDEFRKEFKGGFSYEDRRKNVMRIAKVAAILERQGIIPVCAVIAPYRKLRDEARNLFSESILVYLPGGTLWKDTEYEEPFNDEIKSRKIAKFFGTEPYFSEWDGSEIRL